MSSDARVAAASEERPGPQLSDLEIEQLTELAAAAVSTAQAAYSGEMSREEVARLDAQEEARRQEAYDTFKRVLLERDARTYWEGRDAGINKEAERQTNIRSLVLVLVVLAVVMMPIVAMLSDLDPDAFGTFIAPITGIAGTVVGFWFSTVARDSRSTS